MTSYIAAPMIALASRIRATLRPAPQRDPIAEMLEGLEVPPHLIGRHIDVTDGEGRLVATTRRRYPGNIGAMIG